MTRRKKAIVKLSNVSFQYDDSYEQLKNINLTLYEGECVVVTGPSGSGKTTLTRLINGLIPNFYEGRLTGTVVLKDMNVNAVEPWDFGRIVGSVFQDSRSQFFASIVQDEIAFSAENYGMEPDRIRERVASLGEEIRLSHLLKAQVHQLSSGEKQKVAVASARMADPELFVMDEPSANLDMVATKELAGSLATLKQNGKTILIAEHRLYYLLPIADRIIYMSQGEIAAEWTPQELLALKTQQLISYGLRSPIVKGYLPAAEAEKDKGDECVVLDNLTISPGRFKHAVLEDVSFSLRKGEVVAITGANGVGKTTLARTLCGLIRERKGSIQIDGENTTAKQRLGKIWFVMQDSDYQLFSDSVMNELMLSHEQEETAFGRAEILLKELDLWSFREHHPAALSGGQKQRLTFAVGLMNQPDILILDEPTSGLDGENLRRVIKLIRKMADTGVTVLLITHDYELVYGACERLLFFQNRRLQNELLVNEENISAIIELMETLDAGS
ncbi:ABC transporter ATP-binding protein [Paenibacillus donghaensis]|uniref:ABC transporter n=1 Tax=Paenibacillus donghaensis TaxID=414771 RepID=A0A2Z2KDU9_9BACL|nr:energy-coupling factor ABC transporter ATP-binding protein [Paenibacillus donghaensis]ASA20169.1 ABC transporter [Paenibacillus donghaensis]